MRCNTRSSATCRKLSTSTQLKILKTGRRRFFQYQSAKSSDAAARLAKAKPKRLRRQYSVTKILSRQVSSEMDDVKRAGYLDRYNTWEPMSGLYKCRGGINHYKRRLDGDFNVKQSVPDLERQSTSSSDDIQQQEEPIMVNGEAIMAGRQPIQMESMPVEMETEPAMLESIPVQMEREPISMGFGPWDNPRFSFSFKDERPMAPTESTEPPDELNMTEQSITVQGEIIPNKMECMPIQMHNPPTAIESFVYRNNFG